jgi:hypothetical protein
MELELSKKDKKLAREIIQKGMSAEFLSGMNQFSEIMQQWKDENLPAQESYYQLFNAVRDFDKKIALRYDRMSGSQYVYVIVAQLVDGFITEADLALLNEEVRKEIVRVMDFRNHFDDY